MGTATAKKTRNGRAIPRPFLKWVGGKTQLLRDIRLLIPEQFKTYYEPFIGGGAVYFHLRPPNAVIGDVNQELIDCFGAVRDCVGDVMDVLTTHKYEQEYYYEVRATDPSTLTLPQKAARTIFLNRTGFNGLYRVNKKGKFNVPFGRYTNPLICDVANLGACSGVLAETELRCGAFKKVLATVGEDDFVYLDPPYVPVSKTANFTSYASGGFGHDDQLELASELERLHAVGAKFVLSNADADGVRAMYEALDIDTLRIIGVQALRAVNSKSTKRGRVGEVLVTNIPV
ncbi:MAG: DNA adenine methylase [Proteobacteria bacterium]|nr:DNA adenine methylase [Pseudomonadota bacterium]